MGAQAESTTAGEAADDAAARGKAAGESARRAYDATRRTMEDRYTAELGRRIAALPDYRTADIWLEGANADETALHLSVSIGDPNGHYRSFSFAVMGVGSDFGTVYEDFDYGGRILEYIKTDRNEDLQAIRYILEHKAADSRPTYGAETCRTYSLDKMKIFKIMFRSPTSLPQSVQQPTLPARSFIETVRTWFLRGFSTSGSSTSR